MAMRNSLKKLRDEIDQIEDEIEAEEDRDKQTVLVVSSVENDPHHREPGIHRHANGKIEILIHRDDEEYERLRDSIDDELSENLVLIRMGPDPVPRPIDDETADE